MTDELVGLLSRSPSGAAQDPVRLRTLLELLDRPDAAVPTAWVGGGPGRSSVVAMVAALLTSLDVTAGALTTPHLQDLRERLRIAGRSIGGDVLREQIGYLDPFLVEIDARFARPVTFDEVLRALSAVWFADAPVDMVLCEGTPAEGDRVDLVVTLGGAVGAVVRTPDDEQRTGGADFGILRRTVAVGGQQVALRGVTGDVDGIFLPLHGEHQAANAAVALASVEALLGYAGGLDGDLVRAGFAAVRLPGRMEVVRRTDGASVVLDGANDGERAQALARTLRTEFTVRHRVVVLGLDAAPVDVPRTVAGADATTTAVVTALAPAVDHVIVTAAPTPDAAPVAGVVAAVRDAGLPVELADTVGAALDQASGVATSEDLVVVAGGLPTAGAARTALGLPPADDLLDMS